MEIDDDLREVYRTAYARKNRECAQKNIDNAQKNSGYTPERTANKYINNKIKKENNYKGFQKENPYNYATDDYEKLYSDEGGSF